MCCWCGRENPSRGRSAVLPGTHNRYFFQLILIHSTPLCLKQSTNSTKYFITVKQERNDIPFNNIVTTRQCDDVLNKIKSSEVRSYVFPLRGRGRYKWPKSVQNSHLFMFKKQQSFLNKTSQILFYYLKSTILV